MAQQVCRKLRGLATALAIAALIITLAVTASAATQTAQIFNIEQTSNMAVTIYYDTEQPDVSFIAPDGKAIDTAGLSVQTGDNAVCYFIPDAMAGQWQISYDKKSNATLDVNWAPYANAITISQLSFTHNPGEQSAEVLFEVTGDVVGQYRYALYAAITDDSGNVSGKRELTTGYGVLGRTEIVNARLDGLQTHRYHFYLDVWRDEYGLEASDNAVTLETFSVVSANAAEPIEDIHAEVDLTEGVITLDWSEFAVRCDEYVIGVFDAADGSEPIYANAFTGDVTQTAISYNPATEHIRVELSYIINDHTSQMLIKDIPIKTGVEFTFPAVDVTSAGQISVAYTAPESIEAVIAVNGNEQQIMLSGDGAFSVVLEDFDNEISIRYRLSDENTVYLLTYRLSVDSVAPILLLPENDVTLFVETGTFDLAGATEPGYTVTINGDDVATKDDGTFVHTLALKDGENEFIVSAADAAGNVASQLIIIYKLQPGAAVDGAASGDAPTWQTYLPLIIAFAASLVLLALVFLFTRLYAKNKGVSSLYALLTLLCGIFMVCLIVGAAVTGYLMSKHSALESTVKSEKLFEVAQRSVPEAFELIRQHTQYGKWLSDAVTITIVAAVLSAGCLFLAIYFKRKGPPGTKPPKPAATSVFVCPSCGETYKEPTSFCIKCGTKM